MKNLLALLTLLAPFTAVAAVCDTTDLNKVNQRFILAAPVCIASGNYSSADCVKVRQVPDALALESARLTKSGCYGGTYQEDPRTSEYSKLLTTLPGYPPSTDKSATNTGGICEGLITDITRKYDVANLSVTLDGGASSNKGLYINCVYGATKPEIYGDRPIQLRVLYNTSNARYTIE